MKNRFKRAAAITMAAAMVVTLAFVNASAASVKPKKITLNTTSKTVDIKGKAAISVSKVTPKNASRSVKFKSANKKIATVSSKGIVTGKKKGKVTITATSRRNKKVKKSIRITVKNLKPSSIKISASSFTMKRDTVKMLKTTVKPSGVYCPVSYSSSNPAVASVSSKGKITAKAAGTASITVKTKQKNSKGKYLYKKCTVKVAKRPLVIYFSRGENIVDSDSYLKSLNSDYDAMSSASVQPNDVNVVSTASPQKSRPQVTGNNGFMAKWISDAVGADVYSIHVKNPYPQLKKETQQYVLKEEQENGTYPDIVPCDANLNKYDVFYLVFPNWMGQPPKALYKFLGTYKSAFAGKVVVPFVSCDQKEKYGFSESTRLLKSMFAESAVVTSGSGFTEQDLVFGRKTIRDVQGEVATVAVKASKTAEATKVEGTQTVAGQIERAEKLKGQIVTREQIIKEVGQYQSERNDTNGCTHGISAHYFYYAGFTIYTRQETEGDNPTFKVNDIVSLDVK